MTVFRNSSGFEIIPIEQNPIEIYTNSDVDAIYPGQIVKGSDGSKATVTEIRHISGRLYRVILLPQEVTPCS